MIHGTNVLLNQNILGYKVGNKVHFEWNFRWCLGLPKHIETPTIFRNIILHECSLNMGYQWDIHGVSAYLISRFSRSDILCKDNCLPSVASFSKQIAGDG